MKLEEIKSTVESGGKVYWYSKAYEVVKDCHGRFLIVRPDNEHAIGLTWRDGETLNGNPRDFFTVDQDGDRI